MAHSIGMTGMDPHTGAALAEALLQATRRLGDAWRVVDDHDADFVFVDMDSMYGPMSWIRLHAAGKKVIGVTGSSRTQTDFHLAKPFDQDSVEALLRSIVQGPDAAPASLGVRFKKDSGRTRIAVVYAGSAAEAAGLYANDELVAFDGYRVDEERLTARLAEHVPGDVVPVTVFRGERLVQVPVTLGESAYDQLKLVLNENADTQAIELRRQWLEGCK